AGRDQARRHRPAAGCRHLVRSQSSRVAPATRPAAEGDAGGRGFRRSRVHRRPSRVPDRGRGRRGAGSQAAVVMVYLELFISFARVSLFGFGGGPSMIPLVRAEVVEGRGWLTPEAFLDAFAFGNALPGPIVTKLSAYVGHQVAGWPGAAAALAGATLPTMLLILLAVRLVLRGKENQWLRAAIDGIRPVVVALLLLVAWDFAPRALGLAAAAGLDADLLAAVGR